MPAARRRAYRGDERHPQLNRALAFAWTDSLQSRLDGDHALRHVCANLHRRYESFVNKFGYSLLDWRRVFPTTCDARICMICY